MARKVPALRKGLLEPERVLKMAQGIKASEGLSRRDLQDLGLRPYCSGFGFGVSY